MSAYTIDVKEVDADTGKTVKIHKVALKSSEISGLLAGAWQRHVKMLAAEDEEVAE